MKLPFTGGSEDSLYVDALQLLEKQKLGLSKHRALLFWRHACGQIEYAAELYPFFWIRLGESDAIDIANAEQSLYYLIHSRMEIPMEEMVHATVEKATCLAVARRNPSMTVALNCFFNRIVQALKEDPILSRQEA